MNPNIEERFTLYILTNTTEILDINLKTENVVQLDTVFRNITNLDQQIRTTLLLLE